MVIGIRKKAEVLLDLHPPHTDMVTGKYSGISLICKPPLSCEKVSDCGGNEVEEYTNMAFGKAKSLSGGPATTGNSLAVVNFQL